MDIFLQCVIQGIAQGAIYSLIALGYSIIYSTLRMGHFAQGDFFMFGAVVGYYSFVRAEVPLIFSICMAMGFTAILMLIVERGVYRPMYTRPGIGLMIATMGMQYIVQEIVKIVFGSEPRKMPPIFGADNKTYAFKFFGSELRAAQTDLMIILICTVFMISLALFIKYTKVGVAMSAVSINRRAAQLMGIKLTTIIAVTYILAAAFSAMAGVLTAPRFSVVFTMGSAPGAKAMTSAVMGGFGNMPGAMLGGVIMGIIEILSAFYISSAYRDVVVFVVLTTVLFWRPQGILGRRSITKV